MPSPIAHTLLGLIAFELFRIKYPLRSRSSVLFLFIIISNLPDTDLILGILSNDPNLYHQSLFHSLGGAIGIATLTVVITWRWKTMDPKLTFTMVFLLFYGHVLLDFLGSASDTSIPYGVPMLWPLSNAHYSFHTPIFMDIWRGDTNQDFIQGMLNQHNLQAILIELGILTPLLALTNLYNRSRKD